MANFRISQIDHVELFVPDRHAAASWYAEILGLHIVDEFVSWADDPQGPLMIATPEGGTMLALFAGVPQGTRPTAGFHRVAFRVSQAGFDAFLAHVRDHPVCDEQGSLLRELVPVDHGLAHSVYFFDPHGHRLEVTTYTGQHQSRVV